MPVTIRVVVPPELRRALGANMHKAIRYAVMPIGEELKAELHRKPEAPPQTGRKWYERRFGPKWRSDPKRRWKRTKRAVIYGGDWAGVKTSEQLSVGRWEVKRTARGAIVGNPVTYSPVVHSHEEQARIHKDTGWLTDKQAADKVIQSGKVDRIVKAAVARVLKGMG